MSFRRMLSALIFAISNFSACAIPARHDAGFGPNACSAGQQCTLMGKLTLHEGTGAWAALLVSGKDCAKLALPDDFYKDAGYWNHRELVVTGRAFMQPADQDDGMVVFWYTEQERKLSMGMCDGGIGICVDTMRSRNGRSWPPLSK